MGKRTLAKKLSKKYNINYYGLDLLVYGDDIRHFYGHAYKSMEISYVVLDRLRYDKNFIDEVCYLIKFHDMPISENKILDNYDLEYKRYLIQKCDVFSLSSR